MINDTSMGYSLFVVGIPFLMLLSGSAAALPRLRPEMAPDIDFKQVQAERRSALVAATAASTSGATTTIANRRAQANLSIAMAELSTIFLPWQMELCCYLSMEIGAWWNLCPIGRGLFIEGAEIVNRRKPGQVIFILVWAKWKGRASLCIRGSQFIKADVKLDLTVRVLVAVCIIYWSHFLLDALSSVMFSHHSFVGRMVLKLERCTCCPSNNMMRNGSQKREAADVHMREVIRGIEPEVPSCVWAEECKTIRALRGSHQVIISGSVSTTAAIVNEVEREMGSHRCGDEGAFVQLVPGAVGSGADRKRNGYSTSSRKRSSVIQLEPGQPGGSGLEAVAGSLAVGGGRQWT
ncbi:hypothetical protein AKJ16_DCAP20678 [Drosera capensis]